MESGNNLSIETGDTINNAAGTIKSGGSQQIKAGHALTNTEGTLAADGNINIQTDKMTGDGIVSAGKKPESCWKRLYQYRAPGSRQQPFTSRKRKYNQPQRDPFPRTPGTGK